jgi:hypothetical protein
VNISGNIEGKIRADEYLQLTAEAAEVRRDYYWFSFVQTLKELCEPLRSLRLCGEYSHAPESRKLTRLTVWRGDLYN